MFADRRGHELALHGLDGPRLRPRASGLLVRSRAREPEVSLEHDLLPGPRCRPVRSWMRRAGFGRGRRLRRLLRFGPGAARDPRASVDVADLVAVGKWGGRKMGSDNFYLPVKVV